MKKRVLWLLAGVLLLLLGMFQGSRYITAGLEMDVIISRIETKDMTDDGPISYHHKYYANFTYEGKTYTDVHVATKRDSSHIPPHSVGDTITVVLNPENPGRTMANGEMFMFVGVVLVVYYAVRVAIDRRKGNPA